MIDVAVRGQDRLRVREERGGVLDFRHVRLDRRTKQIRAEADSGKIRIDQKRVLPVFETVAIRPEVGDADFA